MPSPSCLAENRPDTCFPPVCTHLQTLQRMALQSRQPASSEPMGALHQNPWTVECPVCSRILWPNPPSPKVTPCLLQPFLLVSETQDSWRPDLQLKTEANKEFSTSASPLPYVTRSPIPFRRGPTFSLVVFTLCILAIFSSIWAFFNSSTK